jgi:putative membrane protein
MASQAVTETENVLIPTPSGQEFADKAAKSDAFEIASAKLAGTNSVSKDVQAFAKEMAKAHADSTTKIKSAAQKANPPITPDPMLTGDQQDKLADLRNLKGADFDRKYISEQVDAHKDALSLMKDYASNGDVPTLKTTAAEIAPIVQRHLDMARSLER